MNSNNVCTWGPTPNFDNFFRDNTGDSCSYNVTDPITNVTTPVTELATCGFNSDNKSYCRKFRDEKEAGKIINDAFQEAWKFNLTCHVDTSLQYCKEIEDNVLKSVAIRALMAMIWQTEGANFALIANTETCVKSTILQDYYHMIDSAKGITAAGILLAISTFIIA